MLRPLLLTYNLNPQDEKALRALCDRLQFDCRAVRRDEYALPVGALAGIPISKDAPSAPVEPFDDMMLVICHAMRDQLDALLSGLRQPDLPRIALKAVLTPSNVTWNSCRLRDELAREHAAMARR